MDCGVEDGFDEKACSDGRTGCGWEVISGNDGTDRAPSRRALTAGRWEFVKEEKRFGGVVKAMAIDYGESAPVDDGEARYEWRRGDHSAVWTKAEECDQAK